VISIAFFNNKGGVGKTSLVYHLARMYGELGYRVLAADLDPQSNLSIMALNEERLEELWPDDEHPETIFGAVQPLFGGTGDIRDAHIEPITERVALLVGDLALARLEDDLSTEWPRCLEGRERAFRVTSAFWRLIEKAASSYEAEVCLIDVGPNLGAINRAALIAASHVVVPVAPDLFSLQGLKNLGPVLRQWRETWRQSYAKSPLKGVALPQGEMTPIGYVLMQHAERLGRPTKAYERWHARIPGVYRESVLGEGRSVSPGSTSPGGDQITRIKHYRSLMPLAMDARKPMFLLKPADGAIGAHQTYVQQCYGDFRTLAEAVARRTRLHWSGQP
jgi:cellulose biosynthesis protein BcsQ